MKKYLLLACSLFAVLLSGQIGIGTNTPSATLDARSVPGNTSIADGIMPPSLTGDQLQAKTYGAAQEGTMVYVSSAATAPAGQAINVTSVGLYIFNGSAWDKMQTQVTGVFVPVIVASGSSTPGFLFDPPETTDTYTFAAGSLTTINGNGLNDDTTFTAPTNGTYSFEILLSFYDIELTLFSLVYDNGLCTYPCTAVGLSTQLNTNGAPPRDLASPQLRLINTRSFTRTLNAGDTVGPLIWGAITDPTFRTTSAISDLNMVVSRIAP